MDERLERVWARWCARRVLHLWDAPEVVRAWLDTGDEALRETAWVAAWAAAFALDDAAKEAAGVAASAAAWAKGAAKEAAWVAEKAKEAAWAAWAAGLERVEVEEQVAQQHARALTETLATLLPEHGLSALRLDEAMEDRWLTREVWRVVMEREAEASVPVLQDDGTITYRTEIVRVVADWDVVCDWAGGEP